VIRGVAAALPLVPGTAIWGAAFGAAAVAAGVPSLPALLISVLVWSGTVQMAGLGLLGESAAALFASSLLLSLRFVPMSLGLAAMLRGSPRWKRVLAASAIPHASFALVAAGGERTPAYVAGTWLVQYGSWVLGTAAGALLAPQLPHGLFALSDAVIAVIFAVLTVEACRTREQAAVAAGAGAIALAVAIVAPPGVALLVAAGVASVLAMAVRR
jgi:predicted branched-subunit amino acid permease